MRLSTIPCLVVLWASLGCYNHKFQAREPVAPAIPSSAGASYAKVGVIEFDDMGELWDRCGLSPSDTQPCQLNTVLAWIREQRDSGAAEHRSTVVITFVHGWLHNAESDDDNLEQFSQTIQQLQQRADTLYTDCGAQQTASVNHQENNTQSKCHAQMAPRPLRYIGVYLGWRGKSIVHRLYPLSFFNREAGAHRVAAVSATEVIFRIRQAAKEPRANQVEDGKFVLAGHSFGGLIVERTLAQALTAQIVLNAGDGKIPRKCEDPSGGYEMFADLVVLINPAIEALETQQLIDMMKRSRFHTCPITDPENPDNSFQPPLLVSIKARNDWATGGLFPVAHTFEETNKAFRQYGDAPALSAPNDATPDQKAVFKRTAGYVSFFHNYCYVDEKGSHDSRDPVCNRIIDAVITETNKKPVAAELSQSPNRETKFSERLPKRTASGEHRQAYAWSPPLNSGSFALAHLYTRYDPAKCSDAACDVWNYTPYWIFTVPPSVINGHGGFWNITFEDLLTDIVQETTEKGGKRVSFE